MKWHLADSALFITGLIDQRSGNPGKAFTQGINNPQKFGQKRAKLLRQLDIIYLSTPSYYILIALIFPSFDQDRIWLSRVNKIALICIAVAVIILSAGSP